MTSHPQEGAVDGRPQDPGVRCPACGRPFGDGGHDPCALDPPRFCERCGRRLRVQVLPDGYRASCPRCGPP
ncbi:MAG TPA: hypothetical protein VII47_03285 [Actinomycetota bacterium]